MKFLDVRSDDGQQYSSYKDFWTLVKLSCFETVGQDSPWRDSTETIVSPIANGNVLAWAKEPRKCKLILWQLERRCGTWQEFLPRSFDTIWLADRHQANEARAYHPDVRHVPVGGHPGLGGKPSQAKKYDFCHFSYLWGKREATIRELQGRGYAIAPKAWPPERDVLLAESRAGLCLHQWTPQVKDFYIEPLRLILMAMWRLPIIAEFCHDCFPYKCYTMAEIDAALVDARNYAEENYKVMVDMFPFQRCVEEACK